MCSCTYHPSHSGSVRLAGSPKSTRAIWSFPASIHIFSHLTDSINHHSTSSILNSPTTDMTMSSRQRTIPQNTRVSKSHQLLCTLCPSSCTRWGIRTYQFFLRHLRQSTGHPVSDMSWSSWSIDTSFFSYQRLYLPRTIWKQSPG